jgi:hypothetical protein
MTIKYKLLPHSVAKKFAYLILKHLTSHHEVQALSWAVFPSGREPLIRVYNLLKKNMDFINSYEFNSTKLFNFKASLPDIDKMSAKELNAIHAEFETFITTVTETATGEQNNKNLAVQNMLLDLESNLNGVNNNVHALEHLISREVTSSSSWFSVYLYGEMKSRRIPLKDEEYDHFSLDMKWGDLLLGYGTTGKSLWHIYKGIVI